MPSFEELIQKRLDQKEKHAEASRKEKEEKRLLDEIEAEIIQKLELTGSEMCGGCGYSVTLQEEDVPDTTDWEIFIPFLLETGQMHLVQRRLSSTAWREYYNIYGEYPPGTVARTRKSLSFTKKRSKKTATK